MPTPPTHPAPGYRPDIDGLRALAILPVVLFHAGVPGFAGGFVGVDVFFVISGFLITRIIEDEHASGRFSIAGFYERRVRRILPALFTVLACSTLFAALLLMPTQYQAYSRSLIAATLFVSSFLFRRENGYFDLASDEKPLLHTWSLSVEELYYLFFPMILIWAWRGSRDRQFLVLSLIGAVSFVASAVGLQQDPDSKSVFFLPHFRAWEFLLGALLALARPRPSMPRPLAELASLAGAIMILAAVFGYSESTVFPGTAALLPCLGAALLIAAGQGGETRVGRALASPGTVFLGLISYSLYLWHWPLLVFARTYLGTEPNAWQTLVLILLSVALAAATWRWIERPFRGRRGLLTRRALFGTALAGMLLFVGIGIQGLTTQGWAGRFPPEARHLLLAEEDRDPRQRECMNVRPDADGCLYGRTEAAPSIALWGDSHAAGYAAMLGDLADAHETSVAVYTMPACPPLVDWRPIDQEWRDRCTRFQGLALGRILDAPSIRTVLIGANFAKYPYQDGSFELALGNVVETLKTAGKQVALIDPTPHTERKVPELLSREFLAGRTPTELSQPRARFDSDTRDVREMLDRIARGYGTDRIRPESRLCDSSKCYFYRHGTVYYYDGHHLSLSGAEALKPLFAPLFEPAGIMDPDADPIRRGP
ncbi:acyltransferase family protein [Imhoffiella purpurea]|uniref:O-antigen acetylase n=1 Tax=Imhoffiella purpurea TaxID=1249627 RepID=W9VBL3_9GAMM|nr:acyltransferase family protein [Imhoffiella purpurea]EXJ14351.1 O-antigen acetylase [Imhoffiella purpurea]